MALPTAYLTSTKNLEGIFNAIQSAKAPPKFTQRFLEDLGFKSNPDRLVINVLKALGFLGGDGSPTQRYFEYLDPAQADLVLAEALEEAYADLYQLNRNAHSLGRQELVGKIKTLTQGQASDSVVSKMAGTFLALAQRADFKAERALRSDGAGAPPAGEAPHAGSARTDGAGEPGRGGELAALRLGGLVYNVELHLPESRDAAVYEALFQALKRHLHA